MGTEFSGFSFSQSPLKLIPANTTAAIISDSFSKSKVCSKIIICHHSYVSLGLNTFPLNRVILHSDLRTSQGTQAFTSQLSWKLKCCPGEISRKWIACAEMTSDAAQMEALQEDVASSVIFVYYSESQKLSLIPRSSKKKSILLSTWERSYTGP